jgi:twitching motility protein PilI
MNTEVDNGLRALAGQPFELLKTIEQLTKGALSDAAAGDIDTREWVGIGYRLGADNMVISREEIKELVMVPKSLSRVPGAKTWISGLTNLRGQLLPVVDLKQYLGAGATTISRSARILVLSNREYPVGLMVDEVFGFRRFLDSEYQDSISETATRCEQYAVGEYVRSDEHWLVFDTSKLLSSREFQHAGEE